MVGSVEVCERMGLKDRWANGKKLEDVSEFKYWDLR